MNAPARSLRRGAGLLTMSVAVVGACNYLYSLSLTWLLRTSDYAVFAAGQALLLIGATAATASAPWVLSQEIAGDPGDADRRSEAVSFAIILGFGQAVVAAAICGGIILRLSSPGVALVVVLATIAIFGGATAVGYLQGFERFRLIAALRVGEVGVKIATGLVLVAAGAGVAGALAGFGTAAAAVVAVGATVMAGDLRLRWRALRRRRLWTAVTGLLGIQGGVALLAGLDIVLASLLIAPGPEVASYQVSIVLSRIPLFLSAAISMVVFPRLSAGVAASPRLMRSSLGLFLGVALPLAAVTATIPPALIHLAFPRDYAGVAGLLPITTIAGVMVGVLNLTTTFFQAEKRFRRCAVILACGVLLDALTIRSGLALGGIIGLAAGSAAGLAATAGALLLWTRRAWAGSVALPVAPIALGAASAATLLALRPLPPLWVAAALGVMVIAGWEAFRLRSADELEGTAPDSGPGLRILHLAFEDDRKPGSGGGAIRTREINRRLAARHRVTVVTARYPGCRDRFEDGVHHIHAGLPLGRIGSALTYFLALPLAIHRHPSDLVVEDFAAPVSSALVPLWTRRPVVGMAQWLFAREKSRQYHLPFFAVERLGVGLHHRVIAVSEGLAGELRRMNSRARIDVIPNGVRVAGAPPLAAPLRRDIVYLGRLEIAQKGLDLLIEAFSRIAARTGHDLLIAGDGPDLEAVRHLCRRAGLEGRVRFTGRVGEEARAALLGSAAIVCMPSRYETFGMVAIEALACGTPVVAFDIPCLREVVPPACGQLVAVGDTAALGTALLGLLAAPARRRGMGEAGRAFARRFDWDELARRQEDVYLDAAGWRPEPRPVAMAGRAAS